MSAPAAPRRARRDPTRPDDDIPDEVTPDSVLATMGAETELVESLMDEDRQPLQPGPLSDAAESFRESFEQRPVKTVGFAAAAVCVAGISVKLLLLLLRRVRRRGGRNRRSSDTALDVTGEEAPKACNTGAAAAADVRKRTGARKSRAAAANREDADAVARPSATRAAAPSAGGTARAVKSAADKATPAAAAATGRRTAESSSAAVKGDSAQSAAEHVAKTAAGASTSTAAPKKPAPKAPKGLAALGKAPRPRAKVTAPAGRAPAGPSDSATASAAAAAPTPAAISKPSQGRESGNDGGAGAAKAVANAAGFEVSGSSQAGKAGTAPAPAASSKPVMVSNFSETGVEDSAGTAKAATVAPAVSGKVAETSSVSKTGAGSGVSAAQATAAAHAAGFEVAKGSQASEAAAGRGVRFSTSVPAVPAASIEVAEASKGNKAAADSVASAAGFEVADASNGSEAGAQSGVSALDSAAVPLAASGKLAEASKVSYAGEGHAQASGAASVRSSVSQPARSVEATDDVFDAPPAASTEQQDEQQSVEVTGEDAATSAPVTCNRGTGSAAIVRAASGRTSEDETPVEVDTAGRASSTVYINDAFDTKGAADNGDESAAAQATGSAPAVHRVSVDAPAAGDADNQLARESAVGSSTAEPDTVDTSVFSKVAGSGESAASATDVATERADKGDAVETEAAEAVVPEGSASVYESAELATQADSSPTEVMAEPVEKRAYVTDSAEAEPAAESRGAEAASAAQSGEEPAGADVTAVAQQATEVDSLVADVEARSSEERVESNVNTESDVNTAAAPAIGRGSAAARVRSTPAAQGDDDVTVFTAEPVAAGGSAGKGAEVDADATIAAAEPIAVGSVTTSAQAMESYTSATMAAAESSGLADDADSAAATGQAVGDATVALATTNEVTTSTRVVEGAADVTHVDASAVESTDVQDGPVVMTAKEFSAELRAENEKGKSALAATVHPPVEAAPSGGAVAGAGAGEEPATPDISDSFVELSTAAEDAVAEAEAAISARQELDKAAAAAAATGDKATSDEAGKSSGGEAPAKASSSGGGSSAAVNVAGESLQRSVGSGFGSGVMKFNIDAPAFTPKSLPSAPKQRSASEAAPAAPAKPTWAAITAGSAKLPSSGTTSTGVGSWADAMEDEERGASSAAGKVSADESSGSGTASTGGGQTWAARARSSAGGGEAGRPGGGGNGSALPGNGGAPAVLSSAAAGAVVDTPALQGAMPASAAAESLGAAAEAVTDGPAADDASHGPLAAAATSAPQEGSAAAGGGQADPSDASEPLQTAAGDDEEFSWKPLELAGAGIAKDAPTTGDETAAEAQLVALAKRLSTSLSPTSPAADLKEGVAALLADVEFCRTHQCRPARFAEHACTVADFFYQVSRFEEAEATLDAAIQAARMAEMPRLENTMVNNLGTTLRKLRKLKRAVALHRQHLAHVEATQGLHSQFLILARHNLVEALRVLGRHDEAEAALRAQRAKLEGFVAEARERAAAGKGREVQMIAPSTGAEALGQELETKDEVTAAVQALARCHLDLSKHLAAKDARGGAIAEARKALKLDRDATSEDSPSQFVYLNHLAGRLRAAGREEGGETAAPHLLEARDTFEKLAALMAAQPMYQQSLPQLHQNLTELCHELGDEQAAFKHAQLFVESIGRLVGSDTDPSLHSAWQYVASVHARAGDVKGQQAAQTKALKCKSAALRTRDASHKTKQRNQRKGKK